MADSRIQQARTFFADKNQKGTFIASDIFQLKDLEKTFPLILIHDVVEHIEHKAQFLSDLKRYLSSGGVLFVAFPAWQMPFGGHQQIAQGKVVPFNAITDFEYEKGYNYQLLVEKTILTNPAKPTCNTIYKLVEVLSKEVLED